MPWRLGYGSIQTHLKSFGVEIGNNLELFHQDILHINQQALLLISCLMGGVCHSGPIKPMTLI